MPRPFRHCMSMDEFAMPEKYSSSSVTRSTAPISATSLIPSRRVPITSAIPPIVLGTATFNSQYNPDPYLLPTTRIVHKAFDHGIRAFDTSPYYGPAETLLGAALSTDYIKQSFPRSDYFLSTKVGRIATDTFDYSPTWIRKSVQRSLERLGTKYLDLVFCHDVEFVHPSEVLQAVRALRELRDEGKIMYVGISGYPTGLLCELAELVLKETGEPLDAVMSYANFTLQNTKLWTEAVPRLRDKGGVSVVLNASPLGMGLLRKQGVPLGSMGDFHPSSEGLRKACHEAAKFCEGKGEKLEIIALRFALENWMRLAGSVVGTEVEPISQQELKDGIVRPAVTQHKLGVSVCGVSYVEELQETIQIWESIFAAENGDKEHLAKRHHVEEIALGVKQVLGEWFDNTWASPSHGYSRKVPEI